MCQDVQVQPYRFFVVGARTVEVTGPPARQANTVLSSFAGFL